MKNTTAPQFQKVTYKVKFGSKIADFFSREAAESFIRKVINLGARAKNVQLMRVPA